MVWDATTRVFLALPSIAKSLTVLGGIAFVSLVAYAELTGQRVVIEPFEVPSQLRDSGFTSRTIANKLTDQITTIRATAKTSMRRRQYVPSTEEAAPQVVALGGGISVDAVFQYAREFFGREPVRIVGEIVTTKNVKGEPAEIQITTRVNGKPPKTVAGPLTSLDNLLLQTAEHIFLHTQPYLLASYLYEVDSKRCLEAIHYVLQNDPQTDDARAFNLWGLLLLNAGDQGGAVQRFRDAVRVSSERDIRARAYTNWAVALHRTGQYREALGIVQKAVEADAGHADAYHVWGLILATMEQQSSAPAAGPAAAQMFRRAIAIDPGFVPAYISLSEDLERRNDLPGAIEELRRAVDLDRGSVDLRVRLARALIRANEHGEARQHLQRAVELDPKSFEAHQALGMALMRQGDFRNALARFASASAIAPTDPAPYFNMGLIHRMGGDRERAAREFRKYLALAPDGPAAGQAQQFITELRGGASASR
jgi:tetratricopeptide (TPR) repeat protein